jgi:serine/threonine-protein kinase
VKTQIKDKSHAFTRSDRKPEDRKTTGREPQPETEAAATTETEAAAATEKADKDLLLGTTIKGNFRIEQIIGAGAMGKVYLAEQLSLTKKVAIKVLHKHLKGDESLARRFHREAKAASSLFHQNSISIIDFGESDEGSLYIAMEYLDGRDLSTILNEEFPLPLSRTVKILSQVCLALDEAHHNKIVHRDLKPENIMIIERRDEPDFVKVCDFGIAKVQDPQMDGAQSAITMAGIICGTPQYMSPEQAEGKKLDGRSDLYSLSVILYEMITGHIPFTGETPLSIVTKHLTTAPTPPSELRPDLDIHPALESFVLRQLSKKPENRIATALEYKKELEHILDIVEGRAPFDAAVHAQKLSDDFDTVATTMPTTVRQPKKNSAWLFGGVAAALILTIGFLGWYVLRSDTQNQQQQTDPHKLARTAATATDGAVSQAQGADAAPHKTIHETPRDGGSVATDSAVGKTNADTRIKNDRHRKQRRRRRRKERGRETRQGRETNGRPDESARDTATAAMQPAGETEKGYADHFKEGYRAFSASNYSAALKSFRKARRLNPSSAKVYKYMGKCYMRRNQISRAVRVFRRYLRLAPSASDAWVYRGIVNKHSRPRGGSGKDKSKSR